MQHSVFAVYQNLLQWQEMTSLLMTYPSLEHADTQGQTRTHSWSKTLGHAGHW